MSASGGAKVSRKPAPITGSPRFVSSPLAGAVLGGPVFLLTGGYVLLLSFGLVPGDAVDPWVVVPLGLLFFLAGLYLVVAGIRGTRRARRVRDADRPWTEDRAWTPDRLLGARGAGRRHGNRLSGSVHPPGLRPTLRRSVARGRDGALPT